MSEEIDTANHSLVGVLNDSIVIGFNDRMSKERALNMAAWIVALADPLDKTFPQLLKAIRNT